jgi:hypothetical protein
MSARAVQDTVVVDGETWTVERVWPPKRPGGRAPLEARSTHGTPSADGVRSGHDVRGGHAEPDGEITLSPRHEDPALPAFAALARRGRVVSHRPGKRAVVRLDEGYAKAVRRGRAAKVSAAHERGAPFSAGFLIPEPIDVADVAGEHAVGLSVVPGRTLQELGGDGAVPDAEWRRAWAGWRAAWVTAVRDADVSSLPRHGVADEARVLREWASYASEFADPPIGRALAGTAERIAQRLGATAGGPESLAHRDLHDKQVLWHPERGSGLIDLDTCARADAGLDLGNLAAHVGLALLRGSWSRRRARVAHAEIARAAKELGVTGERLAAWREASRFRIACVHLLRPPGRAAARRELVRLTMEGEPDE